ncbi:MAG: hypothetical protein L0Z50_13635 [Verrucomicrobiales bacterium]|nr:hypothetical protein [Verrucomicrobiales bacterium]
MDGSAPVPEGGVDYAWAVEQFYEVLYKFAFGLAGSESDTADLSQDPYRAPTGSCSPRAMPFATRGR